jgi:WD40 repeat protein
MELRTFAGHTGLIRSVNFSPDGSKILSQSDDNTIRLWAAETGREIAQFVSFTDGEWICITPDSFYNASPNGGRYVSRVISDNNSIREQAAVFDPQIVSERLR